MIQVLDAATKLKMTHEEDDENKIILKAITDVNLPKFSSSDTILFQVTIVIIDQLKRVTKTFVSGHYQGFIPHHNLAREQPIPYHFHNQG